MRSVHLGPSTARVSLLTLTLCIICNSQQPVACSQAHSMSMKLSVVMAIALSQSFTLNHFDMAVAPRQPITLTLTFTARCTGFSVNPPNISVRTLI